MPFCDAHPVVGIDLDTRSLTSPPPVVLLAVGPSKFRLLTRLMYKDRTGHPYPVPPDTGVETTDLASVPWPLWGVLAPYGHQLRPALLHDHLCDLANAMSEGGTEARRTADFMFREALGSVGVPIVRRNVFWAGVSFGRYRSFRPVLATLIAVLAFVSAVVFWTAVGTAVHPFVHLSWSRRLHDFLVGHMVLVQSLAWPDAYVLFVVWAALVVVGMAVFGRDCLAIMTALLASPFVLPALIGTLASSGFLLAVDWAVATSARRLGGTAERYPLPTPGPMLRVSHWLR
jgi:hypothetical protein